KRARNAGIMLVLLMVARTATDAYARRTTPPAGVQLVAWANGATVFGGPSIRFFGGAKNAAVIASTDEVRLALGRLDDYPKKLFVTSEVEGASGLPIATTLCRPPRIDRRTPCLVVYDATSLMPSVPGPR